MTRVGRQEFGNSNPNWKGGISSLRNADQLLDLDEETISLVMSRIKERYKVNKKTKCWEWTRSTFANGRAKITFGENILASRLMYVAYHRTRIGKAYICHSCDNVVCVNPKHLWLGNCKLNAEDMVRKGRSVRGERNHGAKLTELQAIEIIKRVKEGERQVDLAEEFGVNKNAIWNLVHGNTWKYLKR